MKLLETKEKEDMDSGITLLALVVTIIVLLILAGVTISQISGDNGILTQSKRAVITNEFSKYQEELEMFKDSKTMDNAIDASGDRFSSSTLSAGKSVLYYNTITKDEENGNIKNVIPSMDDKYIDYFQIIKGELLFNSDDNQLTKIASDLGIKQSPWDIVAGRLLSSDKNLALQDNDGTITIPATVTSVEEGAFGNTPGLKNVIIPYTVKEIKDSAFASNTEIESITFETKTDNDGSIEGCNKIGLNAFGDCTNLSRINYNSNEDMNYLPESLTDLGRDAFNRCVNLKSITIPGSITTIPENSFAKSGIERVTLNEKIANIQGWAFMGDPIEEVTIPSTIKNIGCNAFGGSSILKTVHIKCTDADIDPRNFCHADTITIPEGGNLSWSSDENTLMCNGTIIYIKKDYERSIETYTIPDTVTSWNYDGLNVYASKLTKIVLGRDLNDFYANKFPSTVKDITVNPQNTMFKVITDEASHKMVIDKDYNLRFTCRVDGGTLTLPETVKFNDTDTAKSINTCKFASMCFVYADKIIINAKEIADWGINCNMPAKSIEIGKNVEKIDPTYCRDGYNYGITVNPENQHFYAADGILYEKNDTGYKVKRVVKKPAAADEVVITIPAVVNGLNVTAIGGGAFYNQNTVTKIVLPETITALEGYDDNEIIYGSFGYCTNLKEINIPASIQSIDNNCFISCNSLGINSIKMEITETQAKKRKINGAPWKATQGMKAVKWANE